MKKRKIFDSWIDGDTGWDVHCAFVDYSDSLEIRFIRKEPDGKLHFAKPIEIEFKEEPHKPGNKEEATLLLTRDQAFNLIGDCKDLFDAKGIRTETETKLQGRLEQMEKHLEDMRKLVFGDE